MSNYYEYLGVPRDASQDTIKAAFREVGRQLHPDRNPGDKEAEDLYKFATEAYEILSNDESRRAYDAMLEGRFQASPSPNGSLTIADVLSSLGGIAGMFMEVMARGSASASPKKGLCAICCGKGRIVIMLGPIALEKDCESCRATGKNDPPAAVAIPKH